MSKIFWLLSIATMLLSFHSYSFDGNYQSNSNNIDSVINEKVDREDLEKNRDIKIMRNLLNKASKDDYSDFNDIVANYPEVKNLFSEALYDAGIVEIEIIDEKGIAYIEFALMKLEDKLLYQKKEADSDKLAMLIDLNSSNGCISCMDLGVVLMQYVVGE